MGQPDSEEKFDMFSCFDTVYECDIQTDGQTDKQNCRNIFYCALQHPRAITTTMLKINDNKIAFSRRRRICKCIFSYAGVTLTLTL